MKISSVLVLAPVLGVFILNPGFAEEPAQKETTNYYLKKIGSDSEAQVGHNLLDPTKKLSLGEKHTQRSHSESSKGVSSDPQFNPFFPRKG